MMVKLILVSAFEKETVIKRMVVLLGIYGGKSVRKGKTVVRIQIDDRVTRTTCAKKCDFF
jgi:hypothetical protein